MFTGLGLLLMSAHACLAKIAVGAAVCMALGPLLHEMNGNIFGRKFGESVVFVFLAVSLASAVGGFCGYRLAYQRGLDDAASCFSDVTADGKCSTEFLRVSDDDGKWTARIVDSVFVVSRDSDGTVFLSSVGRPMYVMNPTPKGGEFRKALSVESPE